MCDPTLAIVGGVLGAVGAVQQGIASKNIAEQNADIAEQQRKNALAQGNIDAERAAKQGAQQQATARAIAGANGRDASFGTANALLGQSAGDIVRDLNNIRLGAARQAFGYEVERNNQIAQGQQALTQGIFSAADSLLGGGLQYASLSAQLDKAKGTPTISNG